MTVNLSELYGRSVLDVSSATTIGSVRCGVVAAREGRVEALALDGTPGEESILAWSAIKSIGPDALTVDNTQDLRKPAEGEDRAAKGDTDPIGKNVFTDAGEAIGQLTDLRVDEDSGRVEEVTIGGERLAGTVIMGSGSYAVVVDRNATRS
ncbi:MAG: PRC-barrel domain-containing protein [Acidimicrobiales bacterium]